MDKVQGEFDFQAWISERPGGTFRDAVRSAVNLLAMENAGLRPRMMGALFCLYCCRERKQIPENFQTQVEEIWQDVKLPQDTEDDPAAMFSPFYHRLQPWAGKCKLKTALRISRGILALDRSLDEDGTKVPPLVESLREIHLPAHHAEPPGSTLLEALGAALDYLTLGDGDLRIRLVDTLYCLFFFREQKIPENFKPDVAAIRREIRIPPGHEEEPFYDQLRLWSKKCKLRTAGRIAQMILALERVLTNFQRS